MCRPIVQQLRRHVCSRGRPLKRAKGGLDFNFVEELAITQRTKNRSDQHGLKVNCLNGLIGEVESKHIVVNCFNANDSRDFFVIHHLP